MSIVVTHSLRVRIGIAEVNTHIRLQCTYGTRHSADTSIYRCQWIHLYICGYRMVIQKFWWSDGIWPLNRSQLLDQVMTKKWYRIIFFIFIFVSYECEFHSINCNAFAVISNAFSSQPQQIQCKTINTQTRRHIVECRPPPQNINSRRLILKWLVNWFKLILIALCLIDNNYVFYAFQWTEFTFRWLPFVLLNHCTDPINTCSRCAVKWRTRNYLVEIIFKQNKNSWEMWNGKITYY